MEFLLNLLGNKFVGSVFNYLKTYWRYCLFALLAGLQLVTVYGWHHEHDNVLKERAAHQLDITNFRKAQADADTKAQAEKTAIQKEAKANADKADAKYSTLLAEYSANLLRYKANQSGSSSTDHHQVSTPEVSDGSGAGSEVPAIISITLDDAKVCAVNTARLQAVHDWAVDQMKDEPQ